MQHLYSREEIHTAILEKSEESAVQNCTFVGE